MKEHLTTPSAPEPEVRAFFSAHVHPPKERPNPESWHKRLCYHRYDVGLTAFGDTMEEGATWSIFLFAMQNPLEPWFLNALRRPDPLPLQGDFEQPWHMHKFVVVSCKPFRYDALPERVLDRTLVIPWISFRMDGALVSNAYQQELKDWEEDWPLMTRQRADGAAPVRAGAVRVGASEVPLWAQKFLKRGRANGIETTGSGADEPIGEPVDHEEDILEAWADLDDAYRLLGAPIAGGVDFFIRERAVGAEAGDGGAIGAEARRGVARRFCTTYGLAQASSWSLNLYTLEFARACATEWCRRSQHFFDIWSQEHDFESEFDDDDLTSCIAPAHWAEFRIEVGHGSNQAIRVGQIDAIVPSRVPLK